MLFINGRYIYNIELNLCVKNIIILYRFYSPTNKRNLCFLSVLLKMVESDTSIHGSSNEEEKDKKEAGTEKPDIIESIIGPIGRWQMWICLLISMIKVSVAWHQLGYMFLGANTKIQCENNETDYCSSECENIVFDKTNFENTIIMEWELVCDRVWMKSMGQSIFMFGVLLGNMIFGILADR